MGINNLRKEIENVTAEIFSLVGKRFVLSREIAKAKIKKGLPVEDVDAERRLKEIISEKCKSYNVDLGFGLRLLNMLVEESKRVQESLTVKTKEKMRFSAPYEVFAKAKEMEREGKTLIHLEIGEPDFGPPESVKEALKDAIKKGYTRYTETAGIPQLREKIASTINQKFQTDISSDQVIVTVGGRYAVFLAISSILSPGEEAIVFEPAWPAYKDCVKNIQAKPVKVSGKLESSWEPDLDALLKSINKSTRMIILNSPNNPTGKIISADVLERIVETARENNLFILSDEVYSDFAFKPFRSILEFSDCRYIYVNSFSKAFGMTGFRIGYAISDVETVKKMTRLQNLCLASVPEFVQYAAIEALNCMEEVGKNAEKIKKRQEILCNALDELPVSYYKPDGGFYVFPRLHDENFDTQTFIERLLTEKGVCVTPGTAFGEDYRNFFRISACQPEETLLEAAKRIGELLK
jgi:aspartate aminotransferase